jgi:iron complex transport system permease protein
VSRSDPSFSFAVLTALALVVAAIAIVAIGVGSIHIAPAKVIDALFGGWPAGDEQASRDALIINGIRLPRVLLGLSVGAALAVAGAIMQGIFRNPLADPGLIGVSSGAAFAAAATIVLGDHFIQIGDLPFLALPVAAFVGALAATLILYAVASRAGRTSMTVMLLAGIALAALASAGTGWLAFVSDDRQLRDLTFWSLGSLGGASWTKVEAVAPLIPPVLIAAPFLARGLNAMALGESEAFHLGINIQVLKSLSIMLVSVAVGAAVACSGLIGFVGIIVPHFLRLVIGPDYRLLLPASALLGGGLLLVADILARTLVAPSELPIGILTATIGGPFFLWLLLSRRQEFEM